MQDINWDDLRVALAIARGGSFAAAARRLAVNESTVARRLERLEGRAGARLFDRGRGGLRPTEAGAEVVRRAEAVESQVQAAETALSGARERAAGTVRVTAVPLVVNHLLAPRVADLLVAHPDLRLELVADPHDLRLTDREADLALRLARPRGESRVIVRRVGDLAYAAYGPAGGTTAALPWIAYDSRMADLPQNAWIAEAVAREGAVPPRLAVNDAETVLRCVRNGAGKSLLPICVGDNAPGLARLGQPEPHWSREVWLMVHPELRGLVRTRVVSDWLAACIAEAGAT